MGLLFIFYFTVFPVFPPFSFKYVYVRVYACVRGCC